MKKKTLVGLMAIIAIASVAIFAGCVEKEVTPNSKEAATVFMKTLPAVDYFEFNNLAFVLSEKDIKPYVVPSQKDWEKSDMGETFGYIGLGLDDAFRATCIVEADAAVLEYPDGEIEHIFANVNRQEFETSRTSGIEILTKKEGAMFGLSYAVVQNKLIIGHKSDVARIVTAYVEGLKGSSIIDQEEVKPLWDKLPEGFTLSIGVGNEHSFVYGLSQVKAWADSTTKIDNKFAKETFIAKCTTAEEANAVKDEIVENILSFSRLTGRTRSVEQVSISENMVIIQSKIALKDIIF